MYPIILVSNNITKTEEFINNYIKEHNVPSYSVFKIEPQKEEITIDQVRNIKKIMPTYSSVVRLFLLFSFNSATHEAQNALLKTLEESADYNHFILIADQYEGILTTIRSRSKLIVIDNLVKTELEESLRDFLDSLSSSSNPVFLSNPYVENINREKAIDLLKNIIIYFHEKLHANDSKAPKILKKIFQVQQLLTNNNLNPQLSIDNLLLFIWKAYTIKKV